MIPQEEKYVRWSEGAEILGVKRNAFFYLVESGQVRSEPGRGPRDGRYSMTDILAVKEKRESGKPRKPHKRSPQPFIIDWIMPGDIPVALKMLQQVYNTEEVDLASAAIYQSWRRNNNKISMGAFSPDRQECYGSIQVVPLDEQVILDILNGKRSETSITPDEVLSYEQPGPYTLLGTNAAVLPGKSSLLRPILAHYMQFWVDMFPERFITRVYAQVVSETGDQLAGHLFMSPLYNVAGPYPAHVLDLARPGIPRIIRRFQEQLRTKAPLPPELQWPPVVQPRVQVAHAQATHAPPPVTPSEPRPTSSKPRSQKEPLPGDYVACERFAKDHGISPSTMRKAVASGRLQAEENDWIAGKAPIKSAFNREQQTAFITIYQTNEHYHQCGNQDCPCQFDTP